MPLTGLICLIIYLYIKCKYTVSVLQVYFVPSTIALFFIYLQMLLLCLNAVLYCHVQWTISVHALGFLHQTNVT